MAVAVLGNGSSARTGKHYHAPNLSLWASPRRGAIAQGRGTSYRSVARKGNGPHTIREKVIFCRSTGGARTHCHGGDRQQNERQSNTATPNFPAQLPLRNPRQGVPGKLDSRPLTNEGAERFRPHRASRASNSRRIYVNVRAPPNRPHRFAQNVVRTTKYTILSFVPKNLWEQFRRVANWYFLLLVVLQLFPELQVSDPVFAAFPLVAILTFTAIKDAFEDVRRAIADRRCNLSRSWTIPNANNVTEGLLRRFVSMVMGGMGTALGYLVPSIHGNEHSNRDDHSREPSCIHLHPDTSRGWRGYQRPSAKLHPRRKTTSASHPHVQHALASSNLASSYTANRTQNSLGPGLVHTMSLPNVFQGGWSEEHRVQQRSNSPKPSIRFLPRIESQSVDVFGWRRSRWRDIGVGDFVLLGKNDSVPADIVILSTSDIDGVCYVETKDLDGETNLKVRSSVDMPGVTMPRNACEAKQFKCIIDAEAPNVNLYSFSGTLMARSNTGSAYNAFAGTQRHHRSLVGQHLSNFSTTEAFAKAPLASSNLLLRGCSIRNTSWVLGVVVYSGLDTKVMLNTGITPSKRSKVERTMNPQITLNFTILAVMCAFCTMASIIFASAFYFSAAIYDYEVIADFLSPAGIDLSVVRPVVSLESTLQVFASTLILFQNIIPISLYVTVEIIRTIQAYFIHADFGMYDPHLDKACEARSWNLSDDLGQIKYVFSDKTGTLTRNIMVLRRISVGGNVYGDEYQAAPDTRKNELVERTRFEIRDKLLGSPPVDGQHSFDALPLSVVDPKLVTDIHTTIKKTWTSSNRHLPEGELFRFWEIVSLCHDVTCQLSDGSNPLVRIPKSAVYMAGLGEGGLLPSDITYMAHSPDDSALVSAARSMGFVFLGRDGEGCFVQMPGMQDPLRYHVLETLEFNSDRKRMSVIVKDLEGNIKLLCKGADSTIFDRLACNRENEIKERRLLRDLKVFGNDGLRTLCFARRLLAPEEFDAWRETYRRALTLIDGRDEAVMRAQEQIECELDLVGATAIEDQLQEGVPETIARLLLAGMKVWVLTGDKLETAITIGFSSNLLKRDMALLVVKKQPLPQSPGDAEETEARKPEEMDEYNIRIVRNQLGDCWKSLFHQEEGHPPHESVSSLDLAFDQARDSPHSMEQADSSNSERPDSKYGETALVIDGHSLRYALMDEVNRMLLLQIGTRCSSVICCRVSPLQKADVVALVRKELEVPTLAIGDGANDVAMIQQANIGVGIAGREGYQAVLSSDFAISQFRFLERLLLIHGRWAYVRISHVILTFFYKNALWVFVLLWDQFISGFTAAIIFEYSYINFYNTCLTVLANLYLGVFDVDLKSGYLSRYPQLYVEGVTERFYDNQRFWLYLLDAIYQSVVIFMLVTFTYGDTVVKGNGHISDTVETGSVLAILAIVNVNVFMALRAKSWSWIWLASLVINLDLVFGFVLSYATWLGSALSSSGISPLVGMDREVLAQPIFWALLPLTLVCCQLPRFVFSYLRQVYYPADSEIVAEIQKLNLDSRSVDGERGLVTTLSGSVSGTDVDQKPKAAVPCDNDAKQIAEQYKTKDATSTTESPNPLQTPRTHEWVSDDMIRGSSSRADANADEVAAPVSSTPQEVSPMVSGKSPALPGIKQPLLAQSPRSAFLGPLSTPCSQFPASPDASNRQSVGVPGSLLMMRTRSGTSSASSPAKGKPPSSQRFGTTLTRSAPGRRRRAATMVYFSGAGKDASRGGPDNLVPDSARTAAGSLKAAGTQEPIAPPLRKRSSSSCQTSFHTGYAFSCEDRGPGACPRPLGLSSVDLGGSSLRSGRPPESHPPRPRRNSLGNILEGPVAPI